jgi:hypothetical protein
MAFYSENYLFNSFACLLIGLLIFCCLMFWTLCVYWVLILYLLSSWWRFSPILELSLDFDNCFFDVQKLFPSSLVDETKTK